jgi:hypothetical protein
MKVLMIEQEKVTADKIIDLLNKIDESIRVVGLTDDTNAAADWLSRNPIPDIILANKSLADGLSIPKSNGIEAFLKLSSASEVFELRAFRYRTLQHLLSEKFRPGYPSLLNNNNGQSVKERFLVKQGQKLLSISTEQIAYFFSQDRFIFFKTFDNQKFLQEYRIEQLEKILPPHLFFRINRSFIVSLSTIKEIHAYFGNRLKLYLSPAPDHEVIVSRKRVADFKAWLGK